MRLYYNQFLYTFPRCILFADAIRDGSSKLRSHIHCLSFLNEALSGSLPLTLFIIPVVVSAWYGGVGPGDWRR